MSTVDPVEARRARLARTRPVRDGTRRWVERNMLIRREGDVRVGDTTRLWYDPADPGADGRIVVELARENPLGARA
ncbi:hypothetical protein J7E29_09750 [Streptomyces sp. ISL-90]|nr:hypothetical protein [Streptomyces sp. ISL-90]